LYVEVFHERNYPAPHHLVTLRRKVSCVHNLKMIFILCCWDQNHRNIIPK